MTEPGPIHPEAANGLALAVIAASDAPMLLLDGAVNVIAASASFCRNFAIDPAKIAGFGLASIGAGEWATPQLGALLRATASGKAAISAYEMDLIRKDQPPRRLVIKAHKLDYAGSDDIRLIVSVADITEAQLALKLKDNLLREKAVLLQELQHRVANSLQIVASVLLLSARRVQSEETREHLRDAHQRVMSIAAVQRQLAVSSMSDVALRPYLTELCESLGASMIHDTAQLKIAVTVDDSVVTPDVSVSLGLIVTELVINALKHAFPGHRKGEITVDYEALGKAWALSVADDGVGMKLGADVPKPGLGTSIIEALAKQLAAEVQIEALDPGTKVSVVHA